MLLKPSKYYVLQELKKLVSQANGELSILELGAGKADVIAQLLPEFPNLHYVGIEPDPTTSAYAKNQLVSYPNATVVNKLAYDVENPISDQDQFDLVMSLSVLEHVKDLNSFFDFASKHTKPNGLHIHLYDLGHSLHPISLKERVQIFLCNSFLRSYLPEDKIASYVSLTEVKGMLGKRGYEVERVTFHNMPDHVSLLKKTEDLEFLATISDLEPVFAHKLSDGIQKERLFPSPCIWAKKIIKEA